MTEFHFLQPLDVLYLRGNRLFADASTPGEAIMPPWPSMVAGALRSQLLVSNDVDSGQFADGAQLTDKLAKSLGTPAEPGAFRIVQFLMAKVVDEKLLDLYFPLPADVKVISDGNTRKIDYLQPQFLAESILSNAPCKQISLFRTEKQAKPDSGLWLNQLGIQAWLNGQKITAQYLVETQNLWKLDSRLGIALDIARRTTIEGQLYTVDAVALNENIGFLSGIDGVEGLLPEKGLLRLGGDGRGAQHGKIAWETMQPDWEVIAKTKRFRLSLATPGIFEQGWLMPGMCEQEGNYIWQTSEFTAHLVTAGVSRAETISGWDLAENCPKPALKAVNTGSVYWFDRFQGDIQALDKLVKEGLSRISAYPDKKRCAEGFNNVFIAAWPH